MHIILLSGGSGKRLWPLSNDIRSKQFIKLFRTDDGGYESMVQRVFGQIKSVDPDADITIATGKSQVSAIKNQLGDNVDVCVEPCRRDTFPAIALAAAYLMYKKGVSRDESVAVCPVDPYVDNTYYEGVKRLTELAADSEGLVLMGIEPTYPSEKYGYIIPEGVENISRVLEFKEKPDVKTAEEYLRNGAIWNAGVFAFRLGYLMDKAHSLIDFSDYDDLLGKYDTLKKISFDYAVVEAEKNISVMRYRGEWKDVGTWNMMSEVMHGNVKGKALLDDFCENTSVVNELEIPVLCAGCKNLIIAAGSDGILVADKDRSDAIKPLAEKMAGDVMFAEKSWGTYTVIDAQPKSMSVKISLRADSSMKYHSHSERKEVWTILSGSGTVVIDGEKREVSEGDAVTIPSGAKHSITAHTDMDIIEVQLGDVIEKSDKTVFEFEET